MSTVITSSPVTSPEGSVNLRAVVAQLELTTPVQLHVAHPEDLDLLVLGVALDTRKITAGQLYVALSGQLTHGAHFVPQALARGATGIWTDTAGVAVLHQQGFFANPTHAPILVSADPRQELGSVAAWLWGFPGRSMHLIGITGTNGKTTMSFLLESALRAVRQKSGVIGTTGVHIGTEMLPADRTTPEAPEVQQLLWQMRQADVTTVAMEVSSHALTLGRVNGTYFDVAIFTGLSQDHLDFHGSMAAYFTAKADLFSQTRSAAGVICLDDDWGRELAQQVAALQQPVTTYGLSAAIPGLPHWRAHRIEYLDTGGVRFCAVSPSGEETLIELSLFGEFNIPNALGALAALHTLGWNAADVARGLTQAHVPGRMQPVDNRLGFAIRVDYAHTPDAVARAVAAAQHYVRERDAGRVLVVSGCGGNRDPEKRFPMGVAAAAADLIIVTDDNPRDEDPATIRAAMLAGVKSVPHGQLQEIGDREQAIAAAIDAAQPDDVVLILGKGHETGQERAGVVSPFSDHEVAAAYVQRRTDRQVANS